MSPHNTVLASCLLVLCAMGSVNSRESDAAREWTGVVDIEKADKGERHRWWEQIETDPINGVPIPVVVPASTMPPTAEATIEETVPSTVENNIPSTAEVTTAPTAEVWIPPTVDSEVPVGNPQKPPGQSKPPIGRHMDIEGNGGCRYGQYLMALFMYDSMSDGWDDTRLALIYEDFGVLQFAFKAGLDDGRMGVEYVCLIPGTCYKAIAAGNLWLDEVGWEIKPVVLGQEDTYRAPIAVGGAPADCTFSFGSEQNPPCPTTCSPGFTGGPNDGGVVPQPQVLPQTQLGFPQSQPTSPQTIPNKPGPTPPGFDGNVRKPSLRPTLRPSLRPTSLPSEKPSTMKPTNMEPTPGPSLSDDFGDRNFVRNNSFNRVGGGNTSGKASGKTSF